MDGCAVRRASRTATPRRSRLSVGALVWAKCSGMTPGRHLGALRHCDGDKPAHVERRDQPADYCQNSWREGGQAEEEDGETQKGRNEGEDARMVRDQRASRRSVWGVLRVASEAAPEECDVRHEERDEGHAESHSWMPPTNLDVQLIGGARREP